MINEPTGSRVMRKSNDSVVYPQLVSLDIINLRAPSLLFVLNL
jgi:hypothetical protein